MTHDCDENCSSCSACYQSSGYSTCRQLCSHAICEACQEPTEPGTDRCPACQTLSEDPPDVEP